MTNSEYLDRLLLRYAGTFDIYRSYRIRGKEYPAYGYFFSCVEKYVLAREANLWSAKSYEHVLFIKTEKLSEREIEEAREIMDTYMEPELVRKGEKTPGKNHMYSFLTIVFLSNETPDKKVLSKAKHFKYEKGYRFNFEGYSQGHMVVACMDSEEVICNFVARRSKKLFTSTFSDVKAGKKGFEQLCADGDAKVFVQEA